eukprot:jgi/Botrbrau1/22515/Bobra.114_2s0040.1
MQSRVQPSQFMKLLALAMCGGVFAGRLAPALPPTSAKPIGAPGPDQQTELNLLFIQQINSGKLALDNRGKGSLVLDGVGRHTIWFADRPGRSAGQVETSFFTGSNFTDANGDWLAKPNAALYISNPGPQASTDVVVILTLSQPTYNESSGAMTYKVQIVPGNSTLQEEGSMQREGSLVTSFLQLKEEPTTPTLLSEVEGGELLFDHAVMFIDHWGGGGGWGRGGGWGGGRGWGRGWAWCGWGWGWCGGWGWGR